MALPNSVKAEWIRLQELYPQLQDVTLKENNRATRTLGQYKCWKNRLTGIVSKRQIWLASWLWKWNSEDHPQMLDTLRHEAAHALAGHEAGHGYTWRQYARELGAEPIRACNLNRVGLQNHTTYKAVCHVCGKVFLSTTRKRNRVCSCTRGQSIPYSEIVKYRLTYVKVQDESELLNV
jgi:predicted SprT family Zn-dependent metalloprotease